jgi:hypothetical protein
MLPAVRPSHGQPCGADDLDPSSLQFNMFSTVALASHTHKVLDYTYINTMWMLTAAGAHTNQLYNIPVVNPKNRPVLLEQGEHDDTYSKKTNYHKTSAGGQSSFRVDFDQPQGAHGYRYPSPLAPVSQHQLTAGEVGKYPPNFFTPLRGIHEQGNNIIHRKYKRHEPAFHSSRWFFEQAMSKDNNTTYDHIQMPNITWWPKSSSNLALNDSKQEFTSIPAMVTYSVFFWLSIAILCLCPIARYYMIKSQRQLLGYDAEHTIVAFPTQYYHDTNEIPVAVCAAHPSLSEGGDDNNESLPVALVAFTPVPIVAHAPNT